MSEKIDRRKKHLDEELYNTSIIISNKTALMLKKIKIFKLETYDEIIKRILKEREVKRGVQEQEFL